MSLPYLLEGVHLNIPMADYRMASGVNISSLKAMAISPAHYLAAKTEPQTPPTPAQVLGTIVHSAVLEQRTDGYVVQPMGMDGRTKAGKEWLAGQVLPVVNASEQKNIEGMIESVKSHPMARTILYESEAHTEVSAWITHDATGLLLKGRADLMARDRQKMGVIADLKTCQHGEAHPDKFSRTIVHWGYYRQASFYLHLFGADFFVFVAVEKEPPYAVACYNMDRESLAHGWRENERDLQRVKECIDKNEWNAYGDGIAQLSLPAWALKDKPTTPLLTN